MPFYRYARTIKKPRNKVYNATPETIGEHIRKKRIESGLLQEAVAKIIEVSEDTITGWENERYHPQIQHYPAIIAFLGFYPFDHETSTIAGKLMQIRYCNGFSFMQNAAMLQVSVEAAKRWERGSPVAHVQMRNLIEKVWYQLPNRLQYPLLNAVLL